MLVKHGLPERGHRMRYHEPGRLHRILGVEVLGVSHLAGQVDQKLHGLLGGPGVRRGSADCACVARLRKVSRHLERSVRDTRRSPYT